MVKIHTVGQFAGFLVMEVKSSIPGNRKIIVQIRFKIEVIDSSMNLMSGFMRTKYMVYVVRQTTVQTYENYAVEPSFNIMFL